MPAIRPLPANLSTIINQNITECKNLGLILDKYQPWSKQFNNQNWALQFNIKELQHGDWQVKTTEDSQAKGHWLACSAAPNGIKRCDPILDPNQKIDPELYELFFERWEDTISEMKGSLFCLKNFSRLVIGLGGKGTLEMGITLHHHGGYPFIPGSALKGLAHSWALFYLADQWGIPAVDNDEFLRRKTAKQKTPLQKLTILLETGIDPKLHKDDPSRLEGLTKALKDLQTDPMVKETNGDVFQVEAADLEKIDAFTNIRQVFGTPGHAGEVVFWGGMSEMVPVFVTEILTPHFKDYYKTQRPNFPTDTIGPEPSTFLALKEGQTFYFGLTPRRTATNLQLVKVARLCLNNGLRELGLGAKTSSGMGLFE